MHTMNINVVRGRSYENLSYESLLTWQFPDLRYFHFPAHMHME